MSTITCFWRIFAVSGYFQIGLGCFLLLPKSEGPKLFVHSCVLYKHLCVSMYTHIHTNNICLYTCILYKRLCVSICTHVCVYLYVHVYKDCVYLYVHMYKRLCVSICTKIVCIYMYTCVYLYVHIEIYCTKDCVYLYVHMSTQTFTRRCMCVSICTHRNILYKRLCVSICTHVHTNIYAENHQTFTLRVYM